MTNREYLNSLSNEELVDFLLSEKFDSLKRSYTSTRGGLISWLDEKYDKESWVWHDIIIV